VPPYLEIYALTRRRDRRTVEQFIATYVDREASEDRAGEELMMLPLDADPGAEERMDEVEWVPVGSLRDILAHGLARPSRAFVASLRPRAAPFTHACLAFTRDEQLVVGLSLDDEGMLPANQAEAERVMHRLMHEFDGHRGLVGVELPAPLSEAGFAEATGPLVTATATKPQA
jgi:hypothetical protein